jgi:hypothetical protein
MRRDTRYRPARAGARSFFPDSPASTRLAVAAALALGSVSISTAGYGPPPVYRVAPPPPWMAPWLGHWRPAPHPGYRPPHVVTAAAVDDSAARATLPEPESEDLNAYTEEARAIVKAYATDLKKALGGAIKESGLVEAVGVCHTEAPQFAAALAEERGWAVARTSLKRRNAGNAPDAWEREVMQAFEARKAAGEAIADLEYAAVVTDGETDGPLFRYMKAIPTEGVCLGCHAGDTVADEVEQAIQRFYPDDRARGFAEGDIRGAFTLQKRLVDAQSG